MLRTPIKTIKRFPLTFKCFTVSGTCPKFGFFQVNSINTGIYYPFDLGFLHIFDEVFGRNDVRDHPSMPNGISALGYLSFIQMALSIPFPCKIILISTPGTPGHEMCGISLVAPCLHTFFKGHTWPVGGAINNGHICPDVSDRFPLSGSLESCFLFLLRFLLRSSCCTNCNKQKSCNKTHKMVNSHGSKVL